MPDYANGKIYKIVNSENDKVYIGSTTKTLAQRMGGHRRCAKSNPSRFYKAMRHHGVENFSIELIKSVPCSNVIELEKVEYKIINKMRERGTKLYNSVIDGKHAASTKIRMGEWQKGSANTNYGKVGTQSAVFKRGSLYFRNGVGQRWIFQWHESGEKKAKSFSVHKYGYEEAKQLAEEYRDKIYPIE